MLSGRLSVREEEEPKLIVESICRIEDWQKKKEASAERKDVPAGTEGRTEARQAAEARKKLFLRLERKQMDRASALLALGAGEIPVYMHLPEEKITLLCPRDHWSDGSESSLRRLREELGEANVVLKE